jgi:hypothetical protein
MKWVVGLKVSSVEALSPLNSLATILFESKLLGENANRAPTWCPGAMLGSHQVHQEHHKSLQVFASVPTQHTLLACQEMPFLQH